ncbi:hypothetical protein QOT17_005093 [Balamuthia mandrillaris]
MSQLQSPIRLMDALCVRKAKEMGNTPPPSASGLTFMAAMQLARKGNWEAAVEKLLAAKQEAEKTPEDLEPLAISVSMLGFAYANLNQWPQAVEAYLEALSLWQREHGERSKALAPFLQDVSLVYHKAGDQDKADEFRRKANEVSK